jgi:hypothetical protein
MLVGFDVDYEKYLVLGKNGWNGFTVASHLIDNTF